jgi:sRNA-binding carbon storage regulator CsrA
MQGLGDNVGNLILKRRVGQRLIISFKTSEAQDLVLAVLTVTEIDRNDCKLSIEADKRIIVMRNELVGIPDAGQGELG